MGEGSNCANIILILVLCMLVFHSNMIHANTYTVGDSQGWNYGVSNWPLGKTFYEGDTLVFSYVPLIHNVVVVNEVGFNFCSALGASGIYGSGSDKITLAKGANYFISGFPDQCLLGMKIAVIAY